MCWKFKNLLQQNLDDCGGRFNPLNRTASTDRIGTHRGTATTHLIGIRHHLQTVPPEARGIWIQTLFENGQQAMQTQKSIEVTTGEDEAGKSSHGILSSTQTSPSPWKSPGKSLQRLRWGLNANGMRAPISRKAPFLSESEHSI